MMERQVEMRSGLGFVGNQRSFIEQIMNLQVAGRGQSDPTTAVSERLGRFRRTHRVGGVLCLSAGIITLGAANQARILEAVQRFDDFGDGAHDIGDLEVDLEEPGIATWRELIFFRIDAVALSGVATPVLTILLASEWWSYPTPSRMTS